MKDRHFIHSGLALLIFFLVGVGGGTYAHAGVDSKPAASSPHSMKGQVVMLAGEVCVVRDGAGKSVLFKIDEKTQIDGSVKEGKTVEVSASADGLALSIREAS